MTRAKRRRKQKKARLKEYQAGEQNLGSYEKHQQIFNAAIKSLLFKELLEKVLTELTTEQLNINYYIIKTQEQSDSKPLRKCI